MSLKEKKKKIHVKCKVVFIPYFIQIYLLLQNLIKIFISKFWKCNSLTWNIIFFPIKWTCFNCKFETSETFYVQFFKTYRRTPKACPSVFSHFVNWWHMPITELCTQIISLDGRQFRIEGCQTPQSNNFITKACCSMLGSICTAVTITTIAMVTIATVCTRQFSGKPPN